MAYFASFLLGMGWGGTSVYGIETLPVFVSILPQKYFVERIGGDQVRVSVMVPAGHSPETYEPTPQQLAKLARARLYFRIRIPFEEVWFASIMAVNPNMEAVRCGEEIPRLPAAETHAMAKERQEERSADPHIWTSPPLVKIIAACIRDTLTARLPTHRHQFEQNYQNFIQDLDQLNLYIHEVLAGINRRRFMVFHPAWRYFAHAYGLEEIAIEQAGKEPGAKTLARLIQQARQENIQTIFVQKQFGWAKAETIGRAIGAEVVVLDPLAEDYINNLRQVATAIAEALQ